MSQRPPKVRSKKEADAGQAVLPFSATALGGVGSRRALDAAQERKELLASLEQLPDIQLKKVIFFLGLNVSELLPSNAPATERAMELIGRMATAGPAGLQSLRQAIREAGSGTSGSVTKVDADLQQVAPAAAPRVVILARDQGSTWASSCASTAFVNLAWGNPKVLDSGACPADVVFLLDKYKHEELVHALIRVVVHGGTNSLRVHDSKDWSQKIELNRPGCMGVKCEWDPKLIEATIHDSVLPYKVTEEFFDNSSVVAGALHEGMDSWVLERIEYFLDRIFQEPEGEAIKLLTLPIHPSFLSPMKESWARWRSQLDADSLLRRHFFRTMLSTPASADSMGSLIRVGPKTVKGCLLAATVFALAIEGAMGHQASVERFGLDNNDASAVKNMRYGGRDAYLLGLELIERQSLALRFGDIRWPRGYGLMARAEVSVEELFACERPMNKDEPQRTLVTLDRQDYSHVTLLTRDTNFCVALGRGTGELRAYVEKIVSKQEQCSRQALESSIVN